MRRTPQQTGGGFTLMEMLVVISIIAVLLVMVLPSLTAAREVARVAAVKSELRSVATALEAYGIVHDDVFPPMRTYCWGGVEEDYCPLPPELAEGEFFPKGSDSPGRRCAAPDRFNPADGVTYKYRAPGPTLHNDAPGGAPSLLWVPDDFPRDPADQRAEGRAYNNVNYPVTQTGSLTPCPVAWVIWSVGPGYRDHNDYNYLMPVPREFWYRGLRTTGLIARVRTAEGLQVATE